MAEIRTIKPQPGPQEVFLSTPADIAVYGGSAGGGKTWGLLLEPLRHINNGEFGGVIFRRTYPQIMNEGGLWDESMNLYPHAGGTGRESVSDWKFGSGARMTFAHMQHDRNRLDWQGAQIPYIGFDELTHFSESQFWYLLSRNRSMCGVRPYMRATTNPDSDSWVAKLVDWWIGDDGYAIPERSGVVRWFARVSGEMFWGDSSDELIAEHGDGIIPYSFTFIRADIYDNKELLAADPGYLARLMALPLVDMEQLLKGNWKIRPEAGKVLNRGWFNVVDAAPVHGESLRFWDFAATEKKTAGEDPDWTVGLKMRVYQGHYYIEDIQRFRLPPAETDERVKNIASQDGFNVPVRWEREPGASGKRDSASIARMLVGFDGDGIPPRGDKVARSKGLASQARAGNVSLVRGDWNDEWLREAHGFPDLEHDDQVDATSGAFNALTGDNVIDDAAVKSAFSWN